MTAVLDRLFLQRDWRDLLSFPRSRQVLYGRKNVGPRCLDKLLLMLSSGDVQSWISSAGRGQESRTAALSPTEQIHRHL